MTPMSLYLNLAPSRKSTSPAIWVRVNLDKEVSTGQMCTFLWCVSHAPKNNVTSIHIFITHSLSQPAFHTCLE